MNKIVGLILSALFIFEIFLFGIPLATQAAVPLPSTEGQGYAYYLPQYSTVVFVYNVSKTPLSNASTLQSAFATYFNVLLNFQFYKNGSSYSLSLPITKYASDVYYAYNPVTNNISYILIFANVIGSNSTSMGWKIEDVGYVQQQLGITNLVLSNNPSTNAPASVIYSIPVMAAINVKYPQYTYIESDIGNPKLTEPIGYFTETISGQVTSAIPIENSKATVSTAPTNSLLVFAPFEFVSPLTIPTPEATGFFNPLQISGALGSSMKAAASTRAYIWGRALINTSIIDPYVSAGTDNLTFQLNYSVPGTLQINMAQVGWVASITNFPSKITYLSYNFSNGYISFLGFITEYDNLSISINGKTVPAPVSGYLSLTNADPYNVSLIAITPKAKTNGSVVEYFSNLTAYYYNTSNQLTYAQFYHLPSQTKNYTLPVYGYYAPPGSTITIQGTFNGTTKTITIVIGSTPTLTTYVAYTTLTATSYEGIMASLSSYYTTSPILSTPPSSIAIKGTTTFQDSGKLSSTSATATVTLLSNATLSFENVPLPGISFDGIIVTPAYPIINGTTEMQYMGTAQYLTTSGEYEIQISGSQIVMQSTMYNGLLNLEKIMPYLGPFSNTLLSPSVPATLTGSGPLTIEFVTVPQYAYITLVDFGIWSNETSVVVQAYSTMGNHTTFNKGYFYATIIPPRIATSSITPKSFECYNAPSVYIYDPDAILVPGNPSGSFTYVAGQYNLNYSNSLVKGAVIFYGSTVYSGSGTFGGMNNKFMISSMGTFDYSSESLSNVNNQISAYQLTLNSKTITPYSNGTYPWQLLYYADNNPTANLFFEQGTGSPTIMPAYYGGLNVSYNNYSNSTMSPEMQVGYVELTPNGANYTIANYVTFKVLSSYAPIADPYQTNSFVTVTPNASFVGATDYYKYVSTDYAVYHYFSSSKQYKVETQVTVPNITAALYFASAETPLYASYTQLYFNESYYGANLPAYLALGTSGPLTWNAPNFNEFGVYATPLYLSKMLYVNVTLPGGNKYMILLTTKNISTLFVSLDAQQLQYCNGTYEFEISIPGLESILNLNAKQLNGSTLTVGVYDYVTHETLVANTKLVALQELALVAKQPGEVFYFLTFKASSTPLTASTPWFIATSMYKEPTLNFTDLEYAHTNPSSILHLTVNSITVFHDGYMAMVYYNSTSGRTIAVNVYGKVVANYSGNLLPTISETAANSGMFNGTLPFTILPNNTVTTLTLSNITTYTNGTLAITLSNGSVVPLGPAGLFVLPIITYQGKLIGYNANVSVVVSDPVSSITVPTYLTSANITPIRLAPIPTIPPISHAPVGNYYYTSPVSISPSNPVINIYATSILPYPFEFYIIAIARPGVNASSAAQVEYYSYQAVVAKPALGIASQPYIEVAVQMSGIIALPAGSYTITMFAVPFAQGPTISEYPASLVFTNVTIS